MVSKTFFIGLQFLNVFFASCQLADTANKNSLYLKPVEAVNRDSVTFSTNLDRVTFDYADSLGYGNQLYLNAKGCKLLINGPTLLLETNDSHTPYFILPNDSITVENDKSKNGFMLLVKGKPVRTNELFFLKLLVIETGPIFNVFAPLDFYLNRAAKNMAELEYFESLITDKQSKRISLLKDYAGKKPISKYFETVAVSCIESDAINATLTLYWKNRDMLLSLKIFDSLVNNSISRLNAMQFIPQLMYLHAAANAVSIGTTRFMDHIIADSIEFKNWYAYTKTHFSTGLRDYLLSRCINDAIRNNIQIPGGYLKEFEDDCTDNTYKQITFNRITEKNKLYSITGTDRLLVANKYETVALQDRLLADKGNLILLDFWASWCAPCRAEMPAAHKLKEQYNGKNVTFLYIAIDENKKDWERANIEERLMGGVSFMLANNKTSTFVKQYNIQSIPRYMLVGKDGKIISTDAPRPSDPKLKELIDKHLK